MSFIFMKLCSLNLLVRLFKNKTNNAKMETTQLTILAQALLNQINSFWLPAPHNIAEARQGY